MKIIWRSTKIEEKILRKMSHWAAKKIFSIPTQKYYTGAYMEETVHDITLKILQRGEI